MEEWKKSFVEKLGHVHSRWAKQLDQALDASVVPVFNDLADFLRHNGFATTVPLQQKGHRSFKFELAEDAYVLLVFQSKAVGEFELSREMFVLGSEPEVRKSTELVAALDEAWARREFQAALDCFVELLGGRAAPAEEELVAV